MGLLCSNVHQIHDVHDVQQDIAERRNEVPSVTRNLLYRQGEVGGFDCRAGGAGDHDRVRSCRGAGDGNRRAAATATATAASGHADQHGEGDHQQGCRRPRTPHQDNAHRAEREPEPHGQVGPRGAFEAGRRGRAGDDGQRRVNRR